MASNESVLTDADIDQLMGAPLSHQDIDHLMNPPANSPQLPQEPRSEAVPAGTPPQHLRTVPGYLPMETAEEAALQPPGILKPFHLPGPPPGAGPVAANLYKGVYKAPTEFIGNTLLSLVDPLTWADPEMIASMGGIGAVNRMNRGLREAVAAKPVVPPAAPLTEPPPQKGLLEYRQGPIQFIPQNAPDLPPAPPMPNPFSPESLGDVAAALSPPAVRLQTAARLLAEGVPPEQLPQALAQYERARGVRNFPLTVRDPGVYTPGPQTVPDPRDLPGYRPPEAFTPSSEEYLYHGSTKAGAEAIEKQGYLQAFPGTPIYLTTKKPFAERHAQSEGGKVFAVKREDIPKELLEDIPSGTTSATVTSLPGFWPWSLVKIPVVREKPPTLLVPTRQPGRYEWNPDAVRKYHHEPEDFATAYNTAGSGPARFHPDAPPIEPVLTKTMEDGINLRPWLADRLMLLPVNRALRDLGPAGEESAQLIQRTLDEPEQLAGTLLNEFDVAMTAVAGRGRLDSLTRLNPWSQAKMGKFYTITPQETRALTDYLYSGGTLDFARYHSRYNLTEQQYQKVRDIAGVYANHTMKVSGNPLIRRLPGVEKPDGTTVPFGEPGMFLPQVPITLNRRFLLGEAFLRRQYNMTDKSVSFNAFRANLRKWVEGMGHEQPTTDVARFHGLESARTWDASVGGTESAFDNLKAAGYESDPLPALTKFVVGAYRRGVREDVNPRLTELQGQLETLLGEKQGWIRGVMAYARGHSPTESLDFFAKDWVNRLLGLHSATLLQYAALPSLNQIAYMFSKAPLSFAKTVLTGGAFPTQSHQQFARQSGATFVNELVQLMNPSTADMKFVAGLMKANWMTGEDRWLRTMGAQVGKNHLLWTGEQFYKNPTSPRLRGMIQETGNDPDTLLQAMKATGGRIDESFLLKAAQTFSNEALGRKDLRGLSLFAQSGNPWARVWLNLHSFALVNWGEAMRQIVKAPVPLSTKMSRALALMGGATVLGELTRDVTYAITTGKDPFDPERTPKWLRDLTGEATGRILDDFIMGASNITLSVLAGIAQSDKVSLLSTVSPTLLTRGVDLVTSPIHTALRIVNPSLASWYREEVKKDKERRRRVRKLLEGE